MQLFLHSSVVLEALFEHTQSANGVFALWSEHCKFVI